jgi:hypothetical protein
MSKEVSQKWEKGFPKVAFTITATSKRDTIHIYDGGDYDYTLGPLTAKGLREIATWINSVADEIDGDPDFQHLKG